MRFNTCYTSKKKVSKTFSQPSLTDQSYKDECDLGFIVENFVSKGVEIPASTMRFEDCTTVKEFSEAMLLVAEAKTNFEQLPSKDRDRFGSVEAYLDFISKRDNLKESYEKGYIDRGSVDLVDVYPERFSVPEDDKSKIESLDELTPVKPPTGESV